MSGVNSIIDNLHSHIDESAEVKVNESFIDLPVAPNTRKLEKFLSEALTKKFSKVFQPFGSFGFDVDAYASDDDDSLVDDVLSSLSIAIVFDDDVTDKVKSIQNVIDKTFKNLPDFKYDKRDFSFYFEVEDADEIIDVMDSIGGYGIRIDRGLYTVMDSDDIESHFNAQMKEWQDERDELEREYNRQRM